MQKTLADKNHWGGASRPLVASLWKVNDVVLLMTDALTFSAFFGAYGFQRFVHSESWPIADLIFNHFHLFHGEYPMFFVQLR